MHSSRQAAVRRPGNLRLLRPNHRATSLYAQGENAFNSNYFLQAADDFKRAQENYTAAGDKASALKARDMAFLAFGASMDFPYNRSAADAELAAALPGASAAQRAAWLDEA